MSRQLLTTGLRATVSGSFRQTMDDVQAAVKELQDAGVRVLSPEDPRVVDAMGEFLFVASDRLRSVRLVQDRHNEAIAASDFLWVVVRDGYVGQSTCFEIGLAHAVGTPVYCNQVPANETLLQYVNPVVNIQSAIERVAAGYADLGALLDPCGSIEHAHRQLDEVKDALEQGGEDAESKVGKSVEAVRLLLSGA